MTLTFTTAERSGGHVRLRKVLCVVDAEGRFLGIVDRADVLRAVGEAVAPLASLPASPDGDE